MRWRCPRYYESPPIICYLDRDIGAAIRRARTRMPGGGENPVAIVRVPRERMVGTGDRVVAGARGRPSGSGVCSISSNSLRPVLQGLQRGARPATLAWQLWERWISEIVADFWSVARVGIASTLGLIGVVSLPRLSSSVSTSTIRTRSPGSASSSAPPSAKRFIRIRNGGA